MMLDSFLKRLQLEASFDITLEKSHSDTLINIRTLPNRVGQELLLSGASF